MPQLPFSARKRYNRNQAPLLRTHYSHLRFTWCCSNCVLCVGTAATRRRSLLCSSLSGQTKLAAAGVCHSGQSPLSLTASSTSRVRQARHRLAAAQLNHRRLLWPSMLSLARLPGRWRCALEFTRIAHSHTVERAPACLPAVQFTNLACGLQSCWNHSLPAHGYCKGAWVVCGVGCTLLSRVAQTVAHFCRGAVGRCGSVFWG